MRKVAKIVIEGKPYLVFQDLDLKNGETLSRRFTHRLRRLILTDLKGVDGEWFGAIEFLYEPIYTWKSGEDTLYDFGETLEYAFANLLPHLPLDMKNVKKIYDESSAYAFVEFSNKPDGFSEDGITYFIELKGNFFKTAQGIVFKDGMNRKAVRREILQVLSNEFEENGTALRIEVLQSSIPVTTKELVFNLRLLKEDEKVEIISSPGDPEKIVSVKIKSDGFKELEGEGQTPLQLPQMVKNYYAPHIETKTYGANSPITVNIDEIKTVFATLQKEIKENPELKNKEEVSQTVEELETEVTKTKNPSKVKELLEKLKGSASWVYQKVITNPIVSGIIVEILMKMAKIK